MRKVIVNTTPLIALAGIGHLNDIDPRDYFMYIFKHMPQEAVLDTETVQKYLPWNTPMYLKDK